MKRNMTLFMFILAISLSNVSNIFAQVPSVFVPWVNSKPVIDGQIGDNEWKDRAVSGAFILYGQKKEASEQTEVFIMRDNLNLYIAFRCHESQIEQIKTTIKDKNNTTLRIEDDCIELEFLTGISEGIENHRQFVINAQGTRCDSDNGNNNDKEKDWIVKAWKGKAEWTLELSIPLAGLGIKPENGSIFRTRFCRIQKPKKECSFWPQLASGAWDDLSYSAWFVFGTYKESAQNKVTELINNAMATSVLPALSSNKESVIEDAKNLIKKIKNKKVLFLKEFKKICSETAALNDSITKLEEQTLTEHFKKIIEPPQTKLTSEASRNGYEVPVDWTPQCIAGKDFWFDIIHLPELWEKAGISNEAFIKESLMRFLKTEAFASNGDLKIKEILSRTNRPFIIGGNNSGPTNISSRTCEEFLEEYGRRFVGFMADECFGNKVRKLWDKMGLPVPHNRDEAFLGFSTAYHAETSDFFHSWSLTYPDFRKRTSPGTATFLDHMILEMGAPFTGQEWGQTTPASMGIAFARGAARQYGKPWRMYLAVFMQDASGCGVQYYKGFRSPEEFSQRGPSNCGPNAGKSLSLQRRQLYAAYISGVGIIRDECDLENLYVANYDSRDIAQTDPLIKVLRDMPYHLSPAGEIRKELYDNIVSKHNRGVSYTPVGLIFDRHHGYIPPYSLTHVLGILPYTEGDFMMRAVHNSLFPWEARIREERLLANGHYGDIFDVITNDADLNTLKNYRALILVGNVDLETPFIERLMEYVKNGGTLLMNTKQIKDTTFPEAFCGCRILDEYSTGRFYYSSLDGIVMSEKKLFKYQRIKTNTAKPLIVCAKPDNQEQDSLVISNTYGSGTVVLTTPDYMYESGSEKRMLNMFHHLISHLRDELLPIEWDGNIEMFINKNSTGWILTMINNNGVIKNAGQPETFNNTHQADVRIKLYTRAGAGQVEKVTEWTKEKKIDFKSKGDGIEVYLTIPPGDIRILDFQIK